MEIDLGLHDAGNDRDGRIAVSQRSKQKNLAGDKHARADETFKDGGQLVCEFELGTSREDRPRLDPLHCGGASWLSVTSSDGLFVWNYLHYMEIRTQSQLKGFVLQGGQGIDSTVPWRVALDFKRKAPAQ